MIGSRRTLPLAALAAAVVAALAFWNLSCGGSTPTSTPVTTLAPAPTPGPTVTPVSSCRFGRGITYPDCAKTVSQLRQDVESAMDRLIRDKPSLFDLSHEYAPGTRAYKVLDRQAYLDGLVAQLVAAGMCSERDVDDSTQQTIRVKDSNEFSEDFDVVLNNGYMRRGPGMYSTTCTPPNFPADRPPDAPPVGSGCGRPFPPPLFKIACRDYLNAGDHHVIDSTPQVNDSNYCRSIGYTDGRGLCAVRMDGAPDRKACEDWIVGTAKDTGLPGPTWTRVSDGAFCTGKESGCMHSPDSKYQLWVYEHGTYKVAGNKVPAGATEGKSCQAYVDR